MRLILLLVISLSISLVSSNSKATYSKEYDLEIVNLFSSDLVAALKLSEIKLKKAIELEDTENQMIYSIYQLNAYISLFQFEKAQLVIDKGLKIVDAEQNIRYESEFLVLISLMQYYKSQFNLALENINKALYLINQFNDDRLLANALQMRSQIYNALDFNDMALLDIEKALTIAKSNNDNRAVAGFTNTLSIIYASIDDLDNAIKYGLEAIRIEEKYYNSLSLLVVYNYNVASYYEDKDELDQAQSYYEKSRNFALILQDTNLINYLDSAQASIFIKQGKLDESEKLLERSIVSFAKMGENSMLFETLSDMFHLQIKKQDFTKAKKYLDESKDLLGKIDLASTNLTYLRNQKELFLVQQLWEKAYTIQEIIEKRIVEGFDKEKEIAIAESQNRINVKFNQEKITLLETRNELQKQSISDANQKQSYLIALVILTSLVLLLTVLGYNKQRKLKQQLYILSNTDYLTKVSNRRFIMQELQVQFTKSANQNTSFALIMIDLDFFKIINDTFGHDTGNKVLIHFAKTAQHAFQNTGKVGRIGGEEWLLIVSEASKSIVKDKLNKFHEDYKNNKPANIPNECKLTFSSGVVFFSNKYKTYENMLADADDAMYEAKAKGREQTVFV